MSPRFFSDYLKLAPRGKLLKIKTLDHNSIQKKLLEFPVFQSILSDVTEQGDLVVSYQLRKPLFRVHDYNNCGLDQQGYIIPLAPFYSPKNLPKIYLGLKTLSWSRVDEIDKACQVLNFFNQKSQEVFKVAMIDISTLQDPRVYRREVIVTLIVRDQTHYLRINSLFIEKALQRYVRLFEEPKLDSELNSCVIFDARICKFATLKKLS